LHATSFLAISWVSPSIRRKLSNAADARGVGEVREASDKMLLSLPDLGASSVTHLRETLGLPWTDGARPSGKKPA
jgi:hypothetical protein